MRRALTALAAVLALAAGACGGGDDDDGGGTGGPGRGGEVVLMTHDSFNVTKRLLRGFEQRTGIEVKILRAGDAGETVNKAILTKDDPLADVLFGVDNTFLSRALDEDLFVPYEAEGIDGVPAALRLDPEHRVTPIDYGDVCLNYDEAWFAGRDLDPPASLADLAEADYRGLTVVENPATSSPGLAFLLATVAEFGEDGWLDYWERLRANDVLVAPGWEQAYFEDFTVGGGGDRPIVVSYASSPPADVVYSDPPRDEPLIGVVEDGCFRQVEFAGILRGTDAEEDARRVVDWLLSREFQEDVPLTMYVFPADPEARLPAVFRKWAVVPDAPRTLDPQAIAEYRNDWIDAWTETVLR